MVTLTVIQAGTGSGAVFASPSQVLGYDQGTAVTLTASPVSIGSGASYFAGWGGACQASGTALTCTITMDANKSVTATFNLLLVLTVNTAGTGSGMVSAVPSGLAYAPGTHVTLTAAPNAGSSFNGWTGGCTGAGACFLTMSTNQSVTANFSLLATTYAGNFSGVFGNFSNADGCTWQGSLSGTQTANITQNVNGTVGGIATATVNIGISAVSGSSCNTNPTSFAASAPISGTNASMTWTFTGVQSFSLTFGGTLSGNSIAGSATATRTFQGNGISGSVNTTLTTLLSNLTLIKQ